jgi:hypothetical protein
MGCDSRMPEGPIGGLGDFVIGPHLHADVNADINLKVVAAEKIYCDINRPCVVLRAKLKGHTKWCSPKTC